MYMYQISVRESDERERESHSDSYTIKLCCGYVWVRASVRACVNKRICRSAMFFSVRRTKKTNKKNLGKKQTLRVSVIEK